MQSIYEHADVLIEILVVVALTLFAAVKIIAHFYNERIENLEKIVHILPADAIEKGHVLRTRIECDQMREHCSNITIVKELDESLRVIRKAVSVLVLYSDHIPQEERDKIIKGLID